VIVASVIVVSVIVVSVIVVSVIVMIVGGLRSMPAGRALLLGGGNAAEQEGDSLTNGLWPMAIGGPSDPGEGEEQQRYQ